MKFLADMGISPLTLAFLNQQGYDAKHLSEEGLYKMADADILEKARQEGRIILTSDLDFGYLMAISRQQMPSVILFRLKDMRPASVNAHLAEVMRRFEADLVTGVFITVTQRRIRARQLPIR